MKPILLTAVAATILLGACMPEEEVMTSPSTAATTSVVAPLVGKRLVSGDITFIINADGTMGGEARGEPIVGVYKATATESCSTYTSPEFLTGREFCSSPVISGDTVIFNRRDGSQSPVYTIEG